MVGRDAVSPERNPFDAVIALRWAGRPRWLMLEAAGCSLAGRLSALAGRQTSRGPFRCFHFEDGDILTPHDGVHAAALGRAARRVGIQGVILFLEFGEADDAATLVGRLAALRPFLAEVAVLRPDLPVLLLMSAALLPPGSDAAGAWDCDISSALTQAADAVARQALGHLEQVDEPVADRLSMSRHLLLPDAIHAVAADVADAVGGLLQASSASGARVRSIGAFLVPAVAGRAELDLAGTHPDPALATVVGRNLFMRGEASSDTSWRTVAAFGAAVIIGAGVLLFAGRQWMHEREADITALVAQIEQGGSAGEIVSPTAVAAIGALAGMIDEGRTETPLVPASWSGVLGRNLAEYVHQRVHATLVAPVVSAVDARLKALQDKVGEYETSAIAAPQAEMERLLGFLAEVVELDLQVLRSRLAEAGTPRQQWEDLVHWVSGQTVPLPFLDSPTIQAAFAKTFSGGRIALRRPQDVAARIFDAGARRLRLAFESSRVSESMAAAHGRAVKELDLILEGNGSPAATIQAVQRLGTALADLAASGTTTRETAAAVRADLAAAAPLLREAVGKGLLTSAAVTTLQDQIEDAVVASRTAMERMTLPGLGTVFDRSGKEVLAPGTDALLQAIDALTAGGFASEPDRPMADLTRLATGRGAPDAALLHAANARLDAFAAWHRDHAVVLPRLVRDGILDVAAQATFSGVLADVGLAFQAERNAVTPMAVAADFKAAVPELIRLFKGLGAFDAGVSNDIGWLVAVRTYRALEQLDAAYSSSPLFGILDEVRRWDGERRLSVVNGRVSEDTKRRLLREERKRLADTVASAEALLTILSIDAVRAAIGRPQLVDKWSRLTEEAAASEAGGAGLAAYVDFVVNVVQGFGVGRCSSLPPASVVAVDERAPLFLRERARVRDALGQRCAALLRFPVPKPKPTLQSALPSEGMSVRIPW